MRRRGASSLTKSSPRPYSNPSVLPRKPVCADNDGPHPYPRRRAIGCRSRLGPRPADRPCVRRGFSKPAADTDKLTAAGAKAQVQPFYDPLDAEGSVSQPVSGKSFSIIRIDVRTMENGKIVQTHHT